MSSIFFVGVLSGFLSGLGMGGGVILVALLTYITKYDQLGLQTLNLLYYIPTAVFAILVYLKNKSIDYKAGAKIILWGIVPTIVSAFVANSINVSHLKKVFAIYLIGVGLVIFINSRKKH